MEGALTSQAAGGTWLTSVVQRSASAAGQSQAQIEAIDEEKPPHLRARPMSP